VNSKLSGDSLLLRAGWLGQYVIARSAATRQSLGLEIAAPTCGGLAMTMLVCTAHHTRFVIAAQAGIHFAGALLDPCLRRDDGTRKG
jgi:hypothetical protein